MQTMRLKSIQIPGETLGLLASFASSIMGPSGMVRSIPTLGELPPRLRNRVGHGSGQQYVWYAWTEGDRVRLITGALAMESSRERGRPVLEVHIYDDNGLLDESGTWMRTEGNRWDRCER